MIEMQIIEERIADDLRVDHASCAALKTTNPANGAVLASLRDSGSRNMARTIGAAAAIWPEWERRMVNKRSSMRYKAGRIVQVLEARLAWIMTHPRFKTPVGSYGQSVCSALFLEWFAEKGKCIYLECLDWHLVRSCSGVAWLYVVVMPKTGTITLNVPNFQFALPTRRLICRQR